jgi:alpha-tubulin suppressor-like RCC1 family protein
MGSWSQHLAIALCSASMLASACGGVPAKPDSAIASTQVRSPAGTARAASVPGIAGIAVQTSANEVFAAQIECGDFHSCARMSDGQVRCWGRDTFGQLGDGGGPEQLRPTLVPGVRAIKQIGLAGSFSCAVTDAGKVMCWGTGRILGDGKLVERIKPTEIQNLRDVLEISVSGVVVCARTQAAITCWGTEKTLAPDETDAAEVAVASTHACVRRNSGSIRCTGDASWAKGGPFHDPGIHDAARVVAGDSFACALTAAAKVSCWGRNQMGELGSVPDMETHAKPREIQGLSNVRSLAAGESQVCAVSEAGLATCWGNNSEAELGIGRISSDERPTTMQGVDGIAELCLASIHGCARTRKNDVFCWGQNTSGQLGDGTKEQRSVPTLVRF